MRPELLSESVDFFAEDPGQMPKTLFVLGGRKPDGAWLADFVGRNGFSVWAVDSGVAACRNAGVSPAVLIGDRDSASSEDWEWGLGSGADEYLHPAAKDLTDFQLAAGLMRERGRAGLVLTGCFGGRFDHLFSIVGTFARERSLCMIDETEGLFLIRPSEEHDIAFRKRPMAISLLPLSEECSGVRLSGVRWPLEGVSLMRDYPWAVSNEALPDGDGTVCQEVRACCGSGLMGFYWSFRK
ncbi:MAG: thiamine diphosphokinase [Synergistaceae bacterium]|nr:thiamine diphosphokinase [Synergistaceae bacterium]